MRGFVGGMARTARLLGASGGSAALAPARQGHRHHDGRPSIKRTPGANGMPVFENVCEAVVTASFSDGDAILVIRDDRLCSLTKELTFGTGDPEK
jgi:hypothetical protein